MSHEQTRSPLVIGHRGAPGYAVEHTERSYRIAMECGVDLIEPDLVPTADGYLLCRHENELSRTTNVKKVAALRDRRTTKMIDGRPHTGWFSEDLTLEELGSLRARERHPILRSHNTRWTDESLLTLDDTIALLAAHNRERGTRVGLCLELKSARHFAETGAPLDDLLLDTLRRCAAYLPDVPIQVEADDDSVLRSLAARTDLPTVQLVCSSAELMRLGGLEQISTYAAALAVHKNMVVRPATSRSPRRESRLVERAHGAGLAVYAWTLRSENRYLPPSLRTGMDDEIGFADPEYRALLDAGIDAVFSDHPDTAVACRDRWVSRRAAGAGARPQRALAV
ncbi:glycerophosphodiester phosphodiesterase family protein [Aeromicrobium chenweiae]|nr:glycerophosphodiester phosphodiesterase family protein [Aeromicrobium chenweiae]